MVPAESGVEVNQGEQKIRGGIRNGRRISGLRGPRWEGDRAQRANGRSVIMIRNGYRQSSTPFWLTSWAPGPSTPTRCAM